ncbi:MAG: SDR family NAD(P)-dependent oxidoreductase [Flammeovirgaceae bacterium]
MDPNNSKKIVFITGATSGIGEASANILANNYKLILCGRREERLLKIKNKLSKKTEVITLNFDVRSKEDVADKINSLPKNWRKINILINNAGNAHGLDFIDDGDIEDWDKMIDINIKGLLYVTKEILNLMLINESGHIINIGSIAGKEVYPKGNVYCASKFAVDALSEGMRIDLVEKNIKVSQISPGLVNTEFSKVRFKNDLEKAKNVYAGMEPLYAEDIADIIKFIVERPDNVNISDLTVLPKSQASSVVVNRKTNI